MFKIFTLQKFKPYIFVRFSSVSSEKTSKNYVSKVFCVNGEFYVKNTNKYLRIIQNPNMLVFHGDIIKYTHNENNYAIPINYISKNNYVCGFINKNKFLIPHGISNFKIPIAKNDKSSINSINSPNSVFYGYLNRNDGSLKCENLNFIGDNLLTQTQEKCIYILEGFGDSLNEVYSSSTNCDENFDNIIDSNINNNFNDLNNENNIDNNYLYDMTNHITFCIDPFDAKDADDAISILDLGDDTFEIGIHVVDIASFLKNEPDSLNYALERCNTYYLFESCLPMFPKESAKIFSFTKDKISSSVSIIFKIDKHKIFDLKVVLGKIKVDHSLTCGFAEKLLEIEEKELDKYSKYDSSLSLRSLSALKNLHSVSHRIKSERFNTFKPILIRKCPLHKCFKKSINTTFDEYAYPNVQSLIEEYMLFANFKIAELMYNKKDKNVLFRSNIPTRSYNRDMYMNELEILRNIFDDEDFICCLLTKKLFNTKYGRFKNNLIHFVLGFPMYLHFTSPIRRFADITVHCRLRYYLLNEKNNLTSKCDMDSIANLTFLASKRADFMEKKSKMVQLHHYIKNNMPFTTDAYVLRPYLYIPTLSLYISTDEHLDKNNNLLKVEVELIPVITNGFMDVKALIKRWIT